MPAAEKPSLLARREAVIREHVDAENSGDVDATIASFHRPRYDIVAIGAVSDGEAAVRQLIGDLVQGFPDFHFEPLKMNHAEHAVFVEGRITGTHRGAWGGLQPRGKKMDVRVACVFDFEEDRLINETVYFDFATIQRQLTEA